jgi:hypothetical protein
VSASASPSASPSAQPSQPAASSPTAASPYAAQLTFADNGKTITLHVGNTVHVALDSAYWKFQPVSAPQVLKLGSTAFVPPSPGTCAHPGMGSGCGTQTADYAAVATGQTSIVATRVSCGEAMLCTGGNGHFQVQVVVVN